jgi:hypothetical protein
MLTVIIPEGILNIVKVRIGNYRRSIKTAPSKLSFLDLAFESYYFVGRVNLRR